MAEETRPSGLPEIDVRERGGPKDGKPQFLDRRLYMQLLVFDCAAELSPTDAVTSLGAALVRRDAAAVIYEDLNNPRGIALLSFSEEPLDFSLKVRPACLDSTLRGLTLKPEFTMLGRSYASGYETDLEYWLLRRPRETVMNEAWPWAIWYPLRRKGAFERLDHTEKAYVLREHASIGKAYGTADLAHDIRLVCHGLDAHDNDFVIGLIGKSLQPLSHVVQAMRSTRQTSEFMDGLGPFFVGRAVWRNAG